MSGSVSERVVWFLSGRARAFGVEQSGSKRLAAVFALAYWAGMRISEIASLRLGQCDINRRTGSITIVGGKGGKTRILRSAQRSAASSLCLYI